MPVQSFIINIAVVTAGYVSGVFNYVPIEVILVTNRWFKLAHTVTALPQLATTHRGRKSKLGW